MKVAVDLELCQGHGQCEDAAPEVFRVNDEGLVDLLMTEPPEALRPKVVDAINRCPADAITLQD